MTLFWIEFIPRTYGEDESYLCTGEPEPHVRWQEILFHSQNLSWRVKVVYHSQNPSGYSIENRWMRRKEFQDFVSIIKFEELPLLDNTVTLVELGLAMTTEDVSVKFTKHVNALFNDRFAKICHGIRCTVTEDVSRVLYPPLFDDTSTPCRWLPEIREKTHIYGGVYRIQFQDENETYVYKEIERPLYKPSDTNVFLQELQNLKLFREVSGIVRLLGIVISFNPYQTRFGTNNQIFIRGFVLEHHSRGTLEQVLMKGTAFSWRRWPLQIAIGLLTLHQKGITHMDLKPSNIVIDNDGNAVIIDISGIGHLTYGWKAPEILETEDPFSLPFETRKRHDIWSYGKLLSILTQSIAHGDEIDLLNEVVAKTMNEDPTLRTELSFAISKFQGFG